MLISHTGAHPMDLAINKVQIDACLCNKNVIPCKVCTCTSILAIIHLRKLAYYRLVQTHKPNKKLLIIDVTMRAHKKHDALHPSANKSLWF